MKKIQWTKPAISMFSDAQIENFLKSVNIIDDYFMLYKTCTTGLSRRYVLENAETMMEPSDYKVFFHMAMEHLEVLYNSCIPKDLRKDEGFTY
jgi:hypothetical protein